MAWGYDWLASYAAQNSGYSSKIIIKYSNTDSLPKKISDISMNMGVAGSGITYTAGDTVTGNGKPIPFYVKVSGSSPEIVSTSITVSNTVGRSGDGSAGYYPIKGDMVSRTVTFPSNVIVAGNSTIEFEFKSNSDNSTNANYVFVWDRDTISGTVTNVTYEISYSANGGSGAPSSQTKIHGTMLTLTSATPTPKKYTITYNANYVGGTISPSSKIIDCTFKNWNTQSNGSGTSYASGANYTANASATLYAQWNDPLAGTLPNPTRAGYEFIGWYTASSGGTKVTSTTVISSNIIIYAHWQILTYTVRFLDGYTTPPGNIIKTQTVNHGANATPPSNPTRAGYSFEGWLGTYTNITSNTDITADWKLLGIWKFNGIIWEKVAIPKKFNSTTNQFEEGIVFKRFNGISWEDLT